MLKKYMLFMGLFLFAQTLFAQESTPQNKNSTAPTSAPQWSNRDMTYRGKNYDVLDSAYYPKFRRKQFHRYVNHEEIFPPKPRNQWEIGAGLGLYNVIGNIPTLMLWQKGGGGLNINVRKALGYIFSLRMQYIYGLGKNLDRSATTSFGGPYTTFNYIPSYFATNTVTATPIYRASRTEAHVLSLDMMFNVYNINFHHARNSIAFFAYGGLGALAYKTRMNALDGNYQPYNFGAIVTDPNASNRTIRKALQSKMDPSYESAAENSGGGHILDKKTLDFAPSIGAGLQYKINKQFNVQLEERYVFPADRFLDGSPYGRPLGESSSIGRAQESINYFSIGICYNLKTKKKSVEPLYWINPLDHAYSELSYPRHMILPNPVLPDEDNDGVTDQFDKCPHTPKGVKVGVDGCPLDTDGDGVPDYKDKELITPTICQPVDADGIGKCPCPEDCFGKMGGGKENKCGNVGAGTLLFTNNSSHISTGMEAQLATLAGQMQSSPLCKVVILGGGSGSKVKEQHSWDHVNAVIQYMGEQHNISRERFIFKYGEAGDENIVTYRVANVDESGASNVPPPHPEIK